MQEKQTFRFKYARNNTKLFLAMTSLKLNEFFLFLPFFRDAWKDYKGQHDNRGRPNHFFCIEDMLLFILYYLKCYPLQEIIAHAFDMSQVDANYWIHLLASILHDALERDHNIPVRIASNLKEVLEKELERRKTEPASKDDNNPPKESAIDLGIDGTERQIVRPTDDELQRQYYSGKTKAHTVDII